jgi:hypothetical protein
MLHSHSINGLHAVHISASSPKNSKLGGANISATVMNSDKEDLIDNDEMEDSILTSNSPFGLNHS